VRARGPQHGLIPRADPQPGPDPRAAQGRCHVRRRDRAKGSSQQPAPRPSGAARRQARVRSEPATQSG
jgi:hypothetical protein